MGILPVPFLRAAREQRQDINCPGRPSASWNTFYRVTNLSVLANRRAGPGGRVKTRGSGHPQQDILPFSLLLEKREDTYKHGHFSETYRFVFPGRADSGRMITMTLKAN